MKKEDPTINQYATKLRQYMVNHTQTELEIKFSLTKGSLSGLLRGVAFPKRDKLLAMMSYLNIPDKTKDEIITAIDRQRLFPCIKDPFIGFRIKAIRAMNKLSIPMVSTEGLTASFIQRVEGGLMDISAEKRLLLSKRLGQSVFIDDARRKVYAELLERYSEEDLLTVGLYLLNKHESVNK